MVGLSRFVLAVLVVLLCKSAASSLVTQRYPLMGGSMAYSLKSLKGLQYDKALQPRTRTRQLSFPSWRIIDNFRSKTKLMTRNIGKLCECYADNLRYLLRLLKRALLAITWYKILASLSGAIVGVSAKLDDLSEIGQSIAPAFHFCMSKIEWASDNVPRIIDYINIVMVLLLLLVTESIPLIAFFAGLKAYHMYNLPTESAKEHQL